MVNGSFRYGLQWGDLQFRYDPEAVAAVKQIPGGTWDKARKTWKLPAHARPAIDALLCPPVARIGYIAEPAPPTVAQFPPNLIGVLRPYQLQGALALATYPGFILSFDLRTGKTLTALTALAGLMTPGTAQAAIVLYPASVEGEWVRQSRQWIGLDVLPLEGHTPFSREQLTELRARPYLLLGCSYELLGKRIVDLLAAVGDRRFVVIADEAAAIKNRKAGRYAAAKQLAEAPNCVRRWALTGTPMRNRPADMWAVFDFVQPGSMGTFFKYAQRYCAAHEGDYGWVYTGSSHEEELSARLALCSMRVTRADAGAYLPPSERRTVLCSMSSEAQSQYDLLEQTHAGAIKRALSSADPSAASIGILKQLASATASAKIPTAIERIQHHCEERGVKALVMATFHDSLKQLWDALEPDEGKNPLEVPVFVAGGWTLPDKRRKIIEQWKATPGPAVLLANTLSSGIGIDLSDADVCIFLELCWVPSDFVQAEGRIQDLHQGKRKTPPLYEYILARHTVDADMGLALIKKQATINAVVGRDVESSAMRDALQGSGVVDQSRLSLDIEDPDAVDKALAALQRRLLGLTADDADMVARATIASSIGEAYEPDEPDTGDEEPRTGDL